MLSALFYLRLMSAQNWLLGRLRRLRHPRYILGAVAGVAYFWFLVIRPMVAPASRRPEGLPPELQAFPLLAVAVPLGLLMVIRVIAAWVAPDNKPGLVFTEAEVAFLFPAPITRRMLVHYKLLSSQLTILLSSLFFALLSNRGRLLGGNMFTHAIGWWVMFSTVSLHATGASFTVARLIEGGVSRRKRQVVVTALTVIFLGLVGYALWRSAPSPTLAERASPWTLFNYATRVMNLGLLRWLLLPFKIMLGPFIASTWREFLVALGPALLLLAAHYLWVLRAETSFEEGSIALAEKRARLIASFQAGNSRFGQGPVRARRGPFALSSAGGRPEIAFLWKNLLSAHGFFRPRTFMIGVALVLVLRGWLGHGSEEQQAALAVIGGVSLILALYALAFGPQFFRQDLRSDLANTDLLKTYPLRGWQVVLGELLTPVSILTGLLWFFLLTTLLAAGSLPGPGGDFDLAPELRFTAAGCLALVLPLVCLLQLMVPNAATLLFPSWAQNSRTRDRGFDAVGQRLIFVAGQILVILLALLPAAAAGVLLWFAATWAFGIGVAIATILATAGAMIILGAEIGLGLWWLGGRFERFDLSLESVK